MAQRRVSSRPAGSPRNRKTSSSYRKPAASKYQSSSRYQKRPAPSGGGAKLILIFILIAVIAAGAFIIIKNLPGSGSGTSISANSDDTIVQGVTIDEINVGGMTKEQAVAAVEQAAESKLANISITFHYKEKSWAFSATELQAAVNAQSVVDQAFELGKEGTAKEKRQIQEQIASEGRQFKTDIAVDIAVLTESLKDVKSEIDQPMVETSVTFDPSGYDFFQDQLDPTVDMSRSMFTITPGSIGYVMDYEKAVQQLNDALTNGWTADITLEVKEEHPKYTVEEMEKSTQLLFHSSSKISTHNKKNANRNHNIGKAIGHFKGMVVMPGEIVDYNLLLGERTIANGWLEAPTITQEKTLENALGGGICQASTTIYNAVFMAGAKILDRGPHSWPAYYNDFGYGMDAMVNWGTDEFIFQNDSEYPMFINTYFWYDAYGNPGYIDVDVYTMPPKDEQGNELHIRADSQILRREDPPAPQYIEDTEGKYSGADGWKNDATLNKQVYTQRVGRDLVEVRVDRVWYKDCIQTDLGEYSGGVEVKRETDHIDLYNSVQAIIYTRPIPAPTASPSPTPVPSGGSG